MLGDKLKIARQQKGWTQSEVAKETYIPQTTISKIENNIVARLMVEDPPKEKPLLEVTEEKKNLDKNTKEVTNDKKIKKNADSCGNVCIDDGNWHKYSGKG